MLTKQNSESVASTPGSCGYLERSANDSRGPIAFDVSVNEYQYRYTNQGRDGDWKLYVNPDGSRVELYDMKIDLTQLNNVSEHHPEVVEKLSQMVLTWSKQLPDGPRDSGAGEMNYPFPKK